jgi:allantoin racemase
MRISYVFPGPMSRSALGAGELTRRAGILQSWAAPGTRVEVREVPSGPVSIESAYEEYLSLPETAAIMCDLEETGADAAILGCFGDPCLDALQEVTSRLVVVGPGQASFHVAAMLGEQFGVVTVAQGVVGPIRRQVQHSGLTGRLAGIGVVDMPVLEMTADPEQTASRAAAAAAELVERGADAIVLGCMSMAFLDLGPRIEERIGVPVVNPVQAALALAEGRARFGMRHSKVAFPTPMKMSAGASLADLVTS